MNKKIISIIGGIILIGAGSFYGGMKYAEGARPTAGRNGGAAFANLSSEERQARFQQTASVGGALRGAMSGDGFAVGEVITKDDKSITVKLRDGGSKIVFFGASAQVAKIVDGTAADIMVGATVTVAGTANQDGSMSAQSIQIRPALVK